MSIRLVQLFCDDELWRKWGGSAVRPVQSQSCPASTVIGGRERFSLWVLPPVERCPLTNMGKKWILLVNFYPFTLIFFLLVRPYILGTLYISSLI